MIRRVVLAALVCCQLASGVGVIVPTCSGKDTSRPFPCMSRPCGCLTYDQCWAGDCCCFTLREKIAWAEANQITPPGHAVRAAGLSSLTAGKACCRPVPKTADCPLCSPTETCPRTEPEGITARWVLGISALRCKGNPLAGMWAAGPALPPALPVTWAFEWVVAGVVVIADELGDTVPSLPDDPPPRA